MSYWVCFPQLITEEDRGFHKSFPSLGIQDRISFQQQQLQHSLGTHIPTQPMTGGGSPMTFYENSIKTTNDRSMSLLAGGGSANASSLLTKSMDVTPDRSLESMLQASQQQVNAIETLLRGSDMSDKGTVSTAIHTAERDPGGNLPCTDAFHSYFVAPEHIKDAMWEV